jgi:hypothetical protein
MARSKEGVEHIAEKNLQHIDLGGGDRNLFGPVIGDDLVNRDGFFRSRIIALWRVNAITIFFVSARFVVNSSDASHAESMATNAACSNGQITRCNATRAASKEKKAKAIGARIQQQYAINFRVRRRNNLCSHSDPNPTRARKIPRNAGVTNNTAGLTAKAVVHDGAPRDERQLVGILDDRVFA